MRCEEIQERFIDLIYDEHGTQRANPELEAHIRSCSACRRELEGLKAAQAALKTWKDEPPLRPVWIPSVAPAIRSGPFSLWRFARYAAVAAVIAFVFLALANAEIGWNREGFSFKTHLLRSAATPSDYYTKAELREILRKVVDDSESRVIETNYLMLQQLMDTMEEERWRDLRLIRNQISRNRNQN